MRVQGQEGNSPQVLRIMQGDWLLGHVLPLLRGTPWELMATWVSKAPPLVKLRIMQRHLVVVGSAEGLKRVFQARPAVPISHYA